jgi:hypothetical protein
MIRRIEDGRGATAQQADDVAMLWLQLGVSGRPLFSHIGQQVG